MLSFDAYPHSLPHSLPAALSLKQAIVSEPDGDVNAALVRAVALCADNTETQTDSEWELTARPSACWW